MKILAKKGTLEDGTNFIKIDMTQFKNDVILNLFGESVKITVEHVNIAKFAMVNQWFLNGKKMISVSYTNK
jgi:hypothetical protein